MNICRAEKMTFKRFCRSLKKINLYLRKLKQEKHLLEKSIKHGLVEIINLVTPIIQHVKNKVFLNQTIYQTI